MTWSDESIREFEQGIHPRVLCPIGGCAQCFKPPRPTDRTAHRSACVDDEGGLSCVCRIGDGR